MFRRANRAMTGRRAILAVANLALVLAMVGALFGVQGSATAAWVAPPEPGSGRHVAMAENTPVTSTATAQAATAEAVDPLTGDPMAALHAEADNVRRLMAATQEIMAVYAQGTPTPEELAAVKAQMVVIRTRVGQWRTNVQAWQTAQSTTAPSAPLAGVLPIETQQRQNWLETAVQLAEGLRAIVGDPAADAAVVQAAGDLAAQLEVELLSLPRVEGPASTFAPPASSDLAASTVAPITSGLDSAATVVPVAPVVPPVPLVPAAPAAPVTPTAQPVAPASNVQVTVTPGPLHDPALATLDFHVTLSTHSVDLSQDLATLATLRLPSGVEVPALAWDGPTGGHHVKGTLSFPKLDSAGAPLLPAAGTLALIIRGVGDLPERVFVLELDQVP